MPQDTDFSGIPGLGDTTGLEEYLNNQSLAQLGITAEATQPTPAQQPAAQPAAQPVTTPTAPVSGQIGDLGQPVPAVQPTVTPTVPQFTAEQIAQIQARNAAIQQQNQARQFIPQPQAQPTVQPAVYTPQQINLVQQAMSRGIPMERIVAALNGNRQTPNPNAGLEPRLANIEQFLEQQQYQQQENAFISKMTDFGDKFGLSEDDLVTFGNTALAKGINLAQVNDVEAVFRAVYPEQYAIRAQRLATHPTSQIYGGSSASEIPGVLANKQADAYVENFLKHTMPNQYKK